MKTPSSCLSTPLSQYNRAKSGLLIMIELEGSFWMSYVLVVKIVL